MAWAVWAMVMVGGGSAGGAPVALVDMNQPWAFRLATNAPSEPVGAWRQRDFDDSGWARGVPGFLDSAYGSTEGTGLVDGGSPWVSACFRASFVVSAPGEIVHWILRANHDAGLVVYLNGVEVGRRGLPMGDGLTLDTPAVAGAWWGDEILLTVPPGTVVSGTNVVALELHKSGVESRTAMLLPELLANFLRGPVVQNVSSNEVTVSWRTAVPTAGLLRLAWDGGEVARLDDSYSTDHVVTVANLPAGTQVRYAAEGLAQGRFFASEWREFGTLSAGGGVRFDVLGDSGLGTRAQRALAARLGQGTAFVLHTGDLVYPMTVSQYVDLRHFSVYRDLLFRQPIFSVLGNHDLYGGDGTYLDMLELPTNPVTGTEHFYSFDAGDVHVVCLFLTMRTQAALYPQYAMEAGSAQYQWLTNDLSSTRKPWRIVVEHSPLASSGPHTIDSHLGEYDYAVWKRLLLPVLSEGGVQLVLAGHDHDYERLAPYAGVHVVVTGGGGGTLYTLAARDPASAQFRSVYHFMRVAVEGDVMSLQAVDAEGAVFDEFTIRRAPSADDVVEAVWHEPAASGGLGDGDGNLVGQVVDVPGVAVQGMDGLTSSAGQLQVCADHQFLHLGLSRVMLRPDQSLVLFVEAPGLAGVTQLDGLGNGRADPEGEGVDALDALAGRVRFDGFRPGLACVLGDELADGTFRSFPRAGTSLDPGQGVFRLEAGFPSVPGALVQQFNESPQRTVSWDEQKADCVRVSIPLGVLGGPAAGDVVRVGAVVGVCGADRLTGGLSGLLDTAYLGAWRGEDPVGGATLLRGFRVRLPVGVGPEGPWVLRVLGLEVLPDRLVVRWRAMPGRTYVLESAPDLAGDLFRAAPDAAVREATGAVESWELPRPGLGEDRRFYRVRLVP